MTVDGRAGGQLGVHDAESLSVSAAAPCEVPGSLFLSPRKYLHNCRPRCEMRGETLRLPPLLHLPLPLRLWLILPTSPTLRSSALSVCIIPFRAQPYPTYLIPCLPRNSGFIFPSTGRLAKVAVPAHGRIDLKSLGFWRYRCIVICIVSYLTLPCLVLSGYRISFLPNPGFILPLKIGLLIIR